MADKRQFGRVFVIELADLKLEMRPPAAALRVAFSIERDKTEIPNNVELAIWNLAPETRARLEQQREMTCRVQAGYGDEPSQLFTGIVTKVESTKDPRSGNWMLRVSAGDGQDKYQKNKVSLSFARGTAVLTVLKQLVAATGLSPGNVSQLTHVAFANGAKELEGPYTAHGSAAFELQVFADSLGIDWSFQDGQFVGARKGQPYAGQGPLITSATGLLEARLDEFGNVEGTALLLPDLIPGVAFRVEAERFSGDYVCVATTHSGDNFDEQNWTVQFHGIPLGALSDGLLPVSTKEDTTPSAASIVTL
jgi:hypothetical protein